MTGNFFNPDWTPKITIPVKRVGEHWEFFYGGDIPVKEGTIGELTISVDQITDERFRQRVTQNIQKRILVEGDELLIALSDRSKNGQRIGKWPSIREELVPPGTTRFERVTLGPFQASPRSSTRNTAAGGLWLNLNGLERCELIGSTINMPEGFHIQTATSLNHALTLLSQAYEKHRISNTGNVYTRVFYMEKNKRWYPLRHLRSGIEADGEQALLQELWADVERQLGWRPVQTVKMNGKQ